MKWLAVQTLAASCTHAPGVNPPCPDTYMEKPKQLYRMQLLSRLLGLCCSVHCCLPPCLLQHSGHSFCPSCDLLDEVVCPQREVLAEAHLKMYVVHITTGIQCTIENEKSRCPVLQNQMMLLQSATAKRTAVSNADLNISFLILSVWSLQAGDIGLSDERCHRSR